MSKDILYFNKAEPWASLPEDSRYAIPFTMTDETDRMLYEGTYEERKSVGDRMRAVLDKRGYILDAIDYSRRLLIIQKIELS